MTVQVEPPVSNSIDPIAAGPRPEIASYVTEAITLHLARGFGRPTFSLPLADSRPDQPVAVSFPSGSTVQIQLLPEDHYPAWPFESMELEQRYSDAGPAVLQVPTRPAFIAWKTAAYIDRRASRDLSHQTRLLITAAEARSIALDAWQACWERPTDSHECQTPPTEICAPL
jgi:hypothetical protein